MADLAQIIGPAEQAVRLIEVSGLDRFRMEDLRRRSRVLAPCSDELLIEALTRLKQTGTRIYPDGEGAGVWRFGSESSSGLESKEITGRR